MSIYLRIPYPNELHHHGIEGQKWGVQNGPPYPLDPEDHSAAEKKALRSLKSDERYRRKEVDKANNIYTKRKKISESTLKASISQYKKSTNTKDKATYVRNMKVALSDKYSNQDSLICELKKIYTLSPSDISNEKIQNGKKLVPSLAISTTGTSVSVSISSKNANDYKRIDNDTKARLSKLNYKIANGVVDAHVDAYEKTHNASFLSEKEMENTMKRVRTELLRQELASFKEKNK